MRKLFFMALTLLCAISASAKEPMTLESGSLKALANASNVVYFKVDYSKVKVYNDGKTFTLQGYLKHRGPDFVADWKKDSAYAYNYLPVSFNKKNKKGASAILKEGKYDILGTVYLTDIDFGNGGSSFVPFAGAKAGGCIISGKLVFTDKNKTKIAVLPFSEVKGMGHVSETIRLGFSYYALMNKLGDILKKENGKK